MSCPPLFIGDVKDSLKRARAVVREEREPARYWVESDEAPKGPVVLCVATGRVCGLPEKTIVDAAAAVHLWALWAYHHDDMVDGSDERNGRPTVNRQWSDSVALLSGDLLLAMALDLLQAVLPPAIPRALSTVRIIAKAELRQKLDARAVLDDHEEHQIEIDEKIAASGYFCALPCSIGAIAADPSNEALFSIDRFGHAFGRGCQIMDDVRDYGVTKGMRRKVVGADFRNGLVTWPMILLLQRAGADERRFLQRALGSGQAEGDFERVVELMRRYDALRDTVREAQAFGTRAKASLAMFGDSEAAEGLAWMVDRYIGDVEA